MTLPVQPQPCTRSDSPSSPAKPLAPTTIPLCLKHLHHMAGTSAGWDGNKSSSCSQLTDANELPDRKIILGLCRLFFFFSSCPIILSFTSSSQHCRNCLGKFSHACASRKWKTRVAEHRIEGLAVHGPWDLPQHLLQIPRHSNEPQAGEDIVWLRSEAVASKGTSWVQSCFPLPVCPPQLLFCPWSPH